MRLIYKSYAITTWGKTSMSISDPDGKEVFRTNTFPPMEEEDLKRYLKEYVNGKKNE